MNSSGRCPHDDPLRATRRLGRVAPQAERNAGRVQRDDAYTLVCETYAVLRVGVVVLGVEEVDRAARFWCEALGYEVRTDGFGGWAMMASPNDPQPAHRSARRLEVGVRSGASSRKAARRS
jgi:hypothetical protein